LKLFFIKIKMALKFFFFYKIYFFSFKNSAMINVLKTHFKMELKNYVLNVMIIVKLVIKNPLFVHRVHFQNIFIKIK
jgi:hypothetical protein